MQEITIDYVDNITANSEIFHHELSTLQYLGYGLFSLAGNTRDMELKIKNSDLFKGLQFSFGTHMGGVFDTRQTAILACFYHWYTNSVYNYVRLVKYIDGINRKVEAIVKPTNKTLTERKAFYNSYFTSVIPEISIWRNKVTAHFAKTDPKKDDDLATLEASVMYPAQFINPYLKVGMMKWHDNGRESQLPEWSLTKSFEDLSLRYWPNLKIPEL